jgi:Protein of unknown function (DUF3168)
MLYAPIFPTLNAAPAVVALLKTGSGQLRVYPAGEAPQQVQTPYLTYQQISGLPENYLGQVPDLDQFGNQVDVWGRTLAEVLAVVAAVRDAIEPIAYITAWLGTSREVDTRLYRMSFEVDWYTDRNTN